ncbi:hypothetical protein Baya_7378 [Bagarius yarrelli]|uniref:Uncharacterized protein n=1 Tax=Bagarius yarrelli TaxID=175774 RepID=A0A556U1U8_BAGYA|nr:hypothetical protein Baya_7378 [Bagarius yarrelli]
MTSEYLQYGRTSRLKIAKKKSHKQKASWNKNLRAAPIMVELEKQLAQLSVYGKVMKI